MRTKEVAKAIKEGKDYIEFMTTAGDNAEWAKTLLAYIEELEKDNIHWRGKYHLVSRKIDVTPNDVIRDKIKELEGYQKQVESKMKEKYSERDTLLQVIGGIYYLKEIIGK